MRRTMICTAAALCLLVLTGCPTNTPPGAGGNQGSGKNTGGDKAGKHACKGKGGCKGR